MMARNTRDMGGECSYVVSGLFGVVLSLLIGGAMSHAFAADLSRVALE
jgi:hypothetical protein